MHFSLAQIIQWLLAYRYFVLFPIAVVEGPIVTVAAGFLSSLGHLNLFIAYGVIVLGEMVGDTIYYWLGRWGGYPFINHVGRHVGITAERVEKIEKHYANHPARTIILGKFAYSLELPFLIAAGLFKVDYKKFASYVFIASVPKSFIFILIGYYSGEAYSNINRYLDAAVFMIVAAISLVLVYLLILKLSRRYTVKNNQNNNENHNS